MQKNYFQIEFSITYTLKYNNTHDHHIHPAHITPVRSSPTDYRINLQIQQLCRKLLQKAV